MHLGYLERVSVCALSVVLVAAVMAVLTPGISVADTMSLGLDTEAVQNAPTQVTYTGETEDNGSMTLALNPANVPCASAPGADSGTTILNQREIITEPQTEVFTGSASFEPTQPGAFLLCGWVTGFFGSPRASASLPIEVRPPHISLALSLPRPPAADRSFTLDLMVTSEVARETIVVVVPDTPAGCPAGPAATSAIHLIDATITGGPVLKSALVKGLPADSPWLFCAWAMVPGTSTPQASSTLVAEVSQAAPAPHGNRHQRKHTVPGGAGRERACGTVDFGKVITATAHASGISCTAARSVVLAVEHAHLPADVVFTPYFKYSPPYSVNTRAGRFTCRREPFGLAGSEHNIRCVRARLPARVRWSTKDN
jgi:hypothetical protein